MPAAINIKGERYGRIIVTKRIGSKKGRALWECVCDCGSVIECTNKTLRNGDKRSCGCLHLERAMEKVREKEKPIGYERITSKGYVEIKTEDGFKRKHVAVMEGFIGRTLIGNEIVHHRDWNKTNNHISNLHLMQHGEHTSFHNTRRMECRI